MVGTVASQRERPGFKSAGWCPSVHALAGPVWVLSKYSRCLLQSKDKNVYDHELDVSTNACPTSDCRSVQALHHLSPWDRLQE